MEVNNQVATEGGGTSLYLDSRDIKATAEGIKVRLYGNAEMGHSYFQQGEKVKVVRTVDFPTMENPTEGYQGAEQSPSPCLYIVAWNYASEAPCLLTLDKKTLINPILTVEADKDLAGATDYDFKMTYDANADASDKYKVVRLDKTDLTADQKKDLAAFAKTIDLAAHAAGTEEAVSPF